MGMHGVDEPREVLVIRHNIDFKRDSKVAHCHSQGSINGRVKRACNVKVHAAAVRGRVSKDVVSDSDGELIKCCRRHTEIRRS